MNRVLPLVLCLLALPASAFARTYYYCTAQCSADGQVATLIGPHCLYQSTAIARLRQQAAERGQDCARSLTSPSCSDYGVGFEPTSPDGCDPAVP